MVAYVNRMSFAIGIALAAFALPASAEPVKIRAGISTNFEGMLPVLAAQEKGYLEEANIELEMLDFQGGGPTVQAFVGDSIDICFCAGDHLVRLRNRGIPTVFLYILDSRHVYVVVGKEENLAGVENLEDLKGRSLGIVSPGGMADNTLRWAIRELGLDPDSDYELVGAGFGASMIASIDGGMVDAGMLVNLDTKVLVEKGGYKIVEDFSELPYPGFTALVKEAWIEEHPAEARGFVEALNKAVADLKSDPELGYGIVRNMYPSLSDDLIKYAVDAAVSRVPENGEIDQAAVDILNSIMLSTEPSLKPITVEESRRKF